MSDCDCHTQSHCWYQTLYPKTRMSGKNQTQNHLQDHSTHCSSKAADKRLKQTF